MDDIIKIIVFLLIFILPAIQKFNKKKKEKEAREADMEKPAKPAAARVPKQPQPATVSAPQPDLQTSARRTPIEPEPVQRDVRITSQGTKERQRGMKSWQDTVDAEPEAEESIFSEGNFMEELFGIKMEQQQPKKRPAESRDRPKKIQAKSAPVTKKKRPEKPVPAVKQDSLFVEPAAESTTQIDFASLTGDQLKKNIVLMEVLGSPRSKRMPGPGGKLPRVF